MKYALQAMSKIPFGGEIAIDSEYHLQGSNVHVFGASALVIKFFTTCKV